MIAVVVKQTTGSARRSTSALYIGWQWRNFFIPPYASCSGRHDVGQENVKIFCSTYNQIADLALILNRLIQFYLNNVTNLHQLTSHSTIDIMPYNMEIVSW